MANESALMEKLVALCKRRGFIFQSSEIYGGRVAVKRSAAMQTFSMAAPVR